MSSHGIGFEVIARDERDHATKWLGSCACGEKWAETTYEATEDEWRKHVYLAVGAAPKPMGNKELRWMP